MDGREREEESGVKEGSGEKEERSNLYIQQIRIRISICYKITHGFIVIVHVECLSVGLHLGFYDLFLLLDHLQPTSNDETLNPT